jgi:hypothetical protein
MKWSKASEDTFISALATAAHSLNPTLTFEAGDVDVLLKIPWYPDDDPDKERVRRVKEISGPEARGLKVIVDISIFNSLATNRNETSTPDVGHDDATGAISGMIKNITYRFQRATFKTKCNYDALYSLAKNALLLTKEVLRDDRLMPRLIREMNALDEEGANESLPESPFHSLYQSQSFIEESILLSSWTVRTEVDDEINYFGPPRPLWHKIFTVIHLFLVTGLCFFALSFVWSLLVACIDNWNDLGHLNVWFWAIPFTRRRYRYSGLDLLDHDEDEIMGSGTGGLELTAQSPRHGGTMAKKRKNTNPQD